MYTKKCTLIYPPKNDPCLFPWWLYFCEEYHKAAHKVQINVTRYYVSAVMSLTLSKSFSKLMVPARAFLTFSGLYFNTCIYLFFMILVFLCWNSLKLSATRMDMFLIQQKSVLSLLSLNHRGDFLKLFRLISLCKTMIDAVKWVSLLHNLYISN